MKQSVANNSISIHFISTNQIYHYYFVFLCFGYHLLLQMSSSKPYSFVGRDSFDDLDSSLDKALHSASNNYFHSSNNKSNGPRSNSQSSVNAIPLETFRSSNNFDEHSDSVPLISDSNIYSRLQNRSISSSSTSLNIAARSFSSKFKKFVRSSVDFFKNAK